MAPRRRRSRTTTVLLCIAVQWSAALAMPGIAFPFNAQVPPVARVDTEYTFQFSASTFSSPPPITNYTYSLSAQPAWLLLDPGTRILSGAPSSADIGAATFTLTAADAVGGTAHMSCALVVSADPPPQLEGDVASKLAGTANLSSWDPPVVSLLPLTKFKFQFERSSFIDIVSRRKLEYYATLTDHTPLPSWLLFDSEALTFSGVAPQLSTFTQSWDIELIASDVQGFAGTGVQFTVAIGRRQLFFVPQEQVVNVTKAQDVDFDGLSGTLFLNGAKVPMDAVAGAEAYGLPEWLNFDPRSFAITGPVPEDAEDASVTVTATDAFGNNATVMVSVKVVEQGGSSFFVGEIGTLTANAGQDFEYRLSDDLFISKEVDLQVLLPATARWLDFDAATTTLSGHAPDTTMESTIKATITAKSSNATESESLQFLIEIQPLIRTTVSASISASPIAPVAPSTGTPKLEVTRMPDKRGLSGRTVAGIVVGALVVLLVVAALLLILCRRRRRRTRNGYVETDVPPRRPISRPILPPDHNAILMTKENETGTEKNTDSVDSGAASEQRPPDPPPQIAPDLLFQPTGRRMKWSKRFSRISQVSSIGNGEDAIRADNNIPEWGRDTKVLHTPHDSFSVPAEMARSSKRCSSELSQSKRAFQRLRQSRQSQQSIGLGIDTGGAAMLPRPSSRGVRSHRRATSGTGMSTAMHHSSLASASTCGTSVCNSTKASDFPRPGTGSVLGTKSIPALTASEKRKSIRLVNCSDSVADSRSLHEKRQSFIRNRASTSLASPLFAHGSRASSNPLRGGQASREASLAGSPQLSKRARSQLTTYSQSSSLEPQARHSRRLSQRVRSAFAPSFPRVITRSSLGADDEGSATRDASSSEFETISSWNSEAEWRAEMALPRHERSWVLPNEGSPTPPPAPPTSRQPSSSRRTVNSTRDSEARRKCKERFRERSYSPLFAAVADHFPANGSPTVSPSRKVAQHKRNRLSEPISLVSSDSLSRSKLDRPRLAQTTSKRSVSVEKVQRLSSLKAETEDVRPGSEVWEAMQSAGLMPPNLRDGKSGTQSSDMSGPAFI